MDPDRLLRAKSERIDRKATANPVREGVDVHGHGCCEGTGQYAGSLHVVWLLYLNYAYDID